MVTLEVRCAGGYIAAMSSPEFPRVGNLPWLDFVNTQPVRDGKSVELLTGFDALVQWLQEGGLLGGEDAKAALARWNVTSEGRPALREARVLRAALRSGAERLAAGRDADDRMVRAINRVLAFRPAYTRLMRSGGGYVSRPEPLSASALHLLVPVAESAAWLLEHGEPELVGRCEGNGCVLLFYDTTRNHSRRWCSMDACGSRAKAMAWYHRSRA